MESFAQRERFKANFFGQQLGVSREATKTVDVEAKALRRLSLPQEAELHIDRIIAANNSLLIMWQPPESPLKPFREAFRPHNHGAKPDSEAG
jgi:hypothetical protein